MKLIFSIYAGFVVTSLAAAYPSALLRGLDLTNATKADLELIRRELEAEQVKSRSLGFDAGAQYISTSGTHKYVPPNFKAGDQRGPCPALNALANHGYLPHNGVGTITQFLQATYQVFGLGLDTSTILAVFGAVISGNGVKWSIGGKSSAVPPPLPILFGQPEGISFSHNAYEVDASPARGDLYQYGNAYKVVLSQFEDLFNLQPDPVTADYGHIGKVDVLLQHRSNRIAQCKTENPYFFIGPGTLLAGTGGYVFITMFANHSLEHPEGRLDQENLKSFFAISGSGPGHFTYKEGCERIPNNWYRRPIGSEYTFPNLLADVIAGGLQYPEFLALGGNTGTVNSFTPLDLGDLTGALYNADDLLVPAKLQCFIHQFMLSVIPSLLAPILRTALGTVFGALGCPVLAAFWNAEVYDIYPGYDI